MLRKKETFRKVNELFELFSHFELPTWRGRVSEWELYLARTLLSTLFLSFFHRL